MNIHIITSSYPADPDDPSGTAGLFVRQFALELAYAGHQVFVQPVARKSLYRPDEELSVIPTTWKGGDQELASMNLLNPINWLIFLNFFFNGLKNTLSINEKHKIDRTLCMWAVPSGVFGLAGNIRQNVPYDVWALGSDIWKIGKIPVLGKLILTKIMKGADRVYADGLQLCRDVNELTGVRCEFLASSRKLPQPGNKITCSETPGVKHFLFVGRYHLNKGPDLLLKAISLLPKETKEKTRFHMFGLGPLEAELKEMISELQLERYVILNGPIKEQDLSDYLASVAFLVIPSRIESIPLVFSDAIQLGTPVIATPVGDLAEIITKTNCGIVTEATAAEALSSAITEAVSTSTGRFRKGTARAYQNFKITEAVASWLEI